MQSMESWLLRSVCLALFVAVLSSGTPMPAWADEPAATEPSLDASLQQFKKDMLDVNKRLLIMEEELLFPANAQFTLFVSLDVGHYLVPDSVTIALDGKPTQSHLYTEREVEALKRGAIQRALTTIIKPGTHRLTAVVAGTDDHGRPVRRAATTDFVKDEGQRYLHLRIVDDTIAQQADLQFRDE